MMDNEFDQSKVAYENGPKKVNHERCMPKSKQFGKEKMPQKGKIATKHYVKKVMAEHNKVMHHVGSSRHKEHR